MAFAWPAGFPRTLDEDWTRAPVESLAMKYDSVERHGWYENLAPTVAEMKDALRPGDVVVDYSGGTGILIGRMLQAAPEGGFGLVNVDSSPKFLRLCLDKFADEPRVAFRLLRFLKEEKRLQYLDEVLGPLVGRVDAIASANAMHLYYDLPGTLAAWRRCIRPGGRVFAQSGNIMHDPPRPWIIDDTVEAIHREAQRLVREDPRFARYASVLDDAGRMARHDELRRKFFLPPRPLSYYRSCFEEAGFRILRVRTRAVEARTDEWLEFLTVYHEGVLGWVGGSERVEGVPPTAEAVRDRQALMAIALDRVLRGKPTFEATWTYLTCEPR